MMNDNKKFIVTIIVLVFILGGLIGYDYVDSHKRDDMIEKPLDNDDHFQKVDQEETPSVEQDNDKQEENDETANNPEDTKKPAEKPKDKPQTNQPEDNNKPENPVHKHKYDILVAEKSHTEYVKESYEEQVPKYKIVVEYICNGCQEKFSDEQTAIDHKETSCHTEYTKHEEKIEDGFETVTKEKEVSKKVVDDPKHYECSCGKRKP